MLAASMPKDWGVLMIPEVVAEALRRLDEQREILERTHHADADDEDDPVREDEDTAAEEVERDDRLRVSNFLHQEEGKREGGPAEEADDFG